MLESNSLSLLHSTYQHSMNINERLYNKPHTLSVIIGERERANLIVQLARFYIWALSHTVMSKSAYNCHKV